MVQLFFDFYRKKIAQLSAVDISEDETSIIFYVKSATHKEVDDLITKIKSEDRSRVTEKYKDVITISHQPTAFALLCNEVVDYNICSGCKVYIVPKDVPGNNMSATEPAEGLDSSCFATSDNVWSAGVFVKCWPKNQAQTTCTKQYLLTCWHGQMKVPPNQLEGSTYFATPRVADKTISLNKPTERRLMGTYDTDKDDNMLDYLLIPLKDEATRCPSIYRKCPVKQRNYELFQGDYKSLAHQKVYKYGHKTRRTTGEMVKMPRKLTAIEDYDAYGNPGTQRKVWKVEIKPEGAEAFAEKGDSGSPVVFERDGKVVVLGLIWRKGANNTVLISPITAAMKHIEEQYNYKMEPVNEATN